MWFTTDIKGLGGPFFYDVFFLQCGFTRFPNIQDIIPTDFDGFIFWVFGQNKKLCSLPC